MPLALGPADCSLFDGQETVTYRPLAGGSVAVAGAVGLSPSRDERTAAGGYFDDSDRVWWLPASALPGVTPREGDTVTDALGVAYTIDSVLTSQVGAGLPAGTMYRLASVRNRS